MYSTNIKDNRCTVICLTATERRFAVNKKTTETFRYKQMRIITEFDNYLISEEASILEAMKRLDDLAGSTLIVHDYYRPVGTLMDSDIRRYILGSKSVDGTVGQVCNRNPFLTDRVEKAQEYLKIPGINIVPIINDKGIIDGIAVRASYVAGMSGREGFDIPVVVMAGGKGTRLYPYTRILPKALIPVGEIPIVEHIVNRFRESGLKDFYFILNHKKEMIKAYFSEGKRDYNVNFIDEDKPLGTGGGLSLLKGKIDGTFILSNCDILIQTDVNQIYNFHKEHNNLITMVCSLKNFEIPYGVVNVDSDGVIEDLQEKPHLPFFTNTGCYIVEPSVIDELNDDEEISFPDIIMLHRQAGEKVGIYPIPEDQWMDMGQPEGLEKMREQFVYTEVL